jgi:hypothetical protein
MNSFNPPSPQRSSLDALFDKIEHDLLALTTAPLDVQGASPRQAVDEFANEFLGHWLLPPRQRLGRT